MNKNQPNIAIIGGGIMGLCTGAALQKAGHALTLFDHSPNEAFPNASTMAGGMLCPYSEIDHLPENYITPAQKSISFWQKNLTPENFQKNGSLLLAHPEDFYILERFEKLLTKHAAVWTALDENAIRKKEPSLSRFKSALHIEPEAHLNPLAALECLKNKTQNIKRQHCDIESAKQKFDWVIDCRGYEAIPENPDLRGVKGEMLVLHNPDFTLNRPVRLMHPRYPLYIVPRKNNEFMIGATMIETENNKQTGVKSALELLSAAYSLHPSFADAKIIAMKAGFRPAYPDNLPRITIENNLIRCNGLFRHGFLLAPVMADVVWDMIEQKQNPNADLFIRGNHENHPKRKRNDHKLRA